METSGKIKYTSRKQNREDVGIDHEGKERRRH